MKVAGQATDFATDPNIQLKTELTANWNGANISAATIKFGTAWWDAQKTNQIHVIPQDCPTRRLGNQWEYKDIHEIHLFSTNLDRKWKMELEVKRILIENATSIQAEGIQWATVTGPRELREPKHRQQVYHSMFTVELWYCKVDA